MDLLKRRQEYEKGRKARDLLEEPPFSEAVSFLRERIWREWRETRPQDTAARELLWAKASALEEIVSELTRMADDAAMAAKELKI